MTERKVPNFLIESNTGSNIKNIVGIVSGKGGVGKSLVTCLLANEMAKKGYKVGIMDGDITGPSIPKYFGLTEKATADSEGHINPVTTSNGIKVISMNLMLPKDDDAVIWRGPVIAGVVKQFYQDVNWGDLDYLFVDMPPGTGDVPLTVFQSIPIKGIVVAMSPSGLV
ncbi:MAG: P-loop NTPase, partial [Finegoldia magna]|nr:P-loop NTPase [Finegoldia magna]